MEDSDRERRDALAREQAREDELAVTQGEDEAIESEDYVNRRRGRRIHIEGTKEREAREQLTPDERVGRMEHAVRGFRIASAGDGLLRGSFGRLPTAAEDMLERARNLWKAMDKFKLEGDNLNVSGSFDKGYTVTRENPCEQQENPGPT